MERTAERAHSLRPARTSAFPNVFFLTLQRAPSDTVLDDTPLIQRMTTTVLEG